MAQVPNGGCWASWNSALRTIHSGGGGICAGAGPKICAKYAQICANMRKNMCKICAKKEKIFQISAPQISAKFFSGDKFLSFRHLQWMQMNHEKRFVSSAPFLALWCQKTAPSRRFWFFCATHFRFVWKYAEICGNFFKKSKICAYFSIAKICAKYAHKSKNMRTICAKVKKYVQNMRKYAQICAFWGKWQICAKICTNMRKYAQRILSPLGYVHVCNSRLPPGCVMNCPHLRF